MSKKIKQDSLIQLDDSADGFALKLDLDPYSGAWTLIISLVGLSLIVWSFLNSEPSLYVFLFGVVILVFAGYAAAIALFNSVILTVNKNALSVWNNPLPRLFTTGTIRETSIPSAEIVQIYCKQFVARRRHWSGIGLGRAYTAWYTLVVKTKTLGHKDLVFEYDQAILLLLLKDKIDTFYKLDKKTPVVKCKDGESLYSNKAEIKTPETY